MVIELTKKFESEVGILKKNEMTIRNYKEKVKSSQWVTER